MLNKESNVITRSKSMSDQITSELARDRVPLFYLQKEDLFPKQMISEVINLYEKTLLGALSDTPKLAVNITLLLTF